jgi:hypothetical protein
MASHAGPLSESLQNDFAGRVNNSTAIQLNTYNTAQEEKVPQEGDNSPQYLPTPYQENLLNRQAIRSGR